MSAGPTNRPNLCLGFHQICSFLTSQSIQHNLSLFSFPEASPARLPVITLISTSQRVWWCIPAIAVCCTFPELVRAAVRESANGTASISELYTGKVPGCSPEVRCSTETLRFPSSPFASVCSHWKMKTSLRAILSFQTWQILTRNIARSFADMICVIRPTPFIRFHIWICFPARVPV